MMGVQTLFVLIYWISLSEGTIQSLDGLGNPVDWWYIVKLPQYTSHENGHCDCPMVDCSNLEFTSTSSSWEPLPEKERKERSSGLCYLYADSNNPSLRFYKEIDGYECLGQNGNDPLSHTLKQINRFRNSSSWAYHNDQFNGMASGRNKTLMCGGSDSFNAHSKGAICYNETTGGGFFLQASTPNFPDPTQTQHKDTFIKLGCQTDNNVYYSQHFSSFSLSTKSIEELATALQSARLCSANHYFELAELLVSSNVLQKGKDSKILYDAFANPEIDIQNTKYLKIKTGTSQINVDVVVKSKRSILPPWVLVANYFKTDISVASWLDKGYGIPIVCAGDSYLSSASHFCLEDKYDDIYLNSKGQPKYNIENLIQANWDIMDLGIVKWHLTGGRGVHDGNHGKWAISTCRNGTDVDNLVIMGDLNMEGFPCSKSCKGSQSGRGGIFFGIQNKFLHRSIISKLVVEVCKCTSPNNLEVQSKELFLKLRMCNSGCISKVEKYIPNDKVPSFTGEAKTFWETPTTSNASTFIRNAYSAIE